VLGEFVGDIRRHLLNDGAVPKKFEDPAANLSFSHVTGPAGISREGRRSCQHKDGGEDWKSAHTPMDWDNRGTAMAVSLGNLFEASH